jgi:hypothetical protein
LLNYFPFLIIFSVHSLIKVTPFFSWLLDLADLRALAH